MKKRATFWAAILSIVILLAQTGHPLEAMLNFVIGGILPGTNVSLKFLPSLAMITGLLWLINGWVSSLRFQMIRRSALLANAENVRAELHSEQSKESTQRRQAIIATKAYEQTAS